MSPPGETCMTDEQHAALATWVSGSNLVVRAVPGAGKSQFLLWCAAQTPGSLIIAYNRELRNHMQGSIEKQDIRARCMTFHELCGYIIGPCKDDDEMDEHVSNAEAGAVEVSMVCKTLLVDEAQDMRPLYLRLLHLVKAQQVAVVGDEMQTVYDYDGATPICLQDPESQWGGDWIRHSFRHSFRLTKEIAAFASAVCGGGEIYSTSTGPRPSLRTINIWQATPVVLEFIRKHTDVVILARTWRHNSALRNMVNKLSVHMNIHIHGFDGSSDHSGCIQISSWHASKGSTSYAVVVFGVDAHTERRPLYVALTRASHHLLIINDKRNPCREVLRCVDYADSDVSSQMAYFHMQQLQHPNAVGNWIRSPRPAPAYRNLEGRTHKSVKLTLLHEETHNVPLPIMAGGVDVTAIYELAVRMCDEYESMGRCAVLEHVRSPAKRNRDDYEAILHQDRYTTSDERLPVAIWAIIDAPANRTIRWCRAACGVLAFQNFQHKMTQLIQCQWADDSIFNMFLGSVQKHVQGQRDVKLIRNGPCILYARAHAISSKCIWHIQLADRPKGPAGIVVLQSQPVHVLHLSTGAVYMTDVTDPESLEKDIANFVAN